MNRFIFIFSILAFPIVLLGCGNDNEDENIEEIEGLLWQDINSDCIQVTVTSVDDYVYAKMKYLVEDAAYVDYTYIKFKKTDLPIHEYKPGMVLDIKLKGRYVNLNFPELGIDVPLYKVKPC